MPELEELTRSVANLLREAGAVGRDSALPFLEIKDQLNLTRWSLEEIESALLQHGYAAREGLGPTRILWLTPAGLELVSKQKAA
ncbi:MAG: hypothetical protein JXA74_14960 [Anaerolineae bacterium]|nr:hypothetical protein [Anaerolineae bacterium]